MTSKIDYNKIANALIVRFDAEASGSDYQDMLNLMNKRELEIYHNMRDEFSMRAVFLRTKESHAIKKAIEDTNRLFSD